MIRLNNIKLDIDDDNILKAVSETLKLDEDKILGTHIVRRSVDARKNEVKFVYSIDVKVNQDEDLLISKVKDASISPEKEQWVINQGSEKMTHRPVIIGAGPAGLFSALLLSEYGFNPLIIERGKKVEERTNDVNNFFNSSSLNYNSNICFGEGGAGTYSDGKLNTRISNPCCYYVLKELNIAGAPKDILIDSKPHVGSDILKTVISNIRKKIETLGGQFLFEHTIDDMTIKDGVVTELIYQKNKIDVSTVILATGHSAKDTYEMLYNNDVAMIQKPFAMGVRIEHPREVIDTALYHEFANHKKLGAASYSLNVSVGDKRAYTFCMCPGGVIVNSANEKDALCINGMSMHKRNGTNSNSAIVSAVIPDMFGSEHVLAGIYLQRQYEQEAFKLGGNNYNVPAMRLCDFLSGDVPKKFEVLPTVMPNAQLSDISKCLPKDVCETIKKAIPIMGMKIKGFDMGGAVLSAVESRTSSPVRILRGDDLMSVNVNGLYPAGEGAGHAGGIVSSAVDGLRVASVIIEKYSSEGIANK